MMNTDAVVSDLVKNAQKDDENLNVEDVKNLEEYKELDEKVVDFNDQMENLQNQFDAGLSLLDQEKPLDPEEIKKVMQMSASKINQVEHKLN